MHRIFSIITQGMKHRGIQVGLVLVLYLLFKDSLPLAAHQALYAISLFIKDVLVWVLPLTIGLFIAQTVCGFERRAPLFILALILFETLSNFSSVWYAFGGAHVAAGYLPSLTLASSGESFEALWRLPLVKPDWWSADKGTLCGLAIGCLGAATKNTWLVNRIQRGKEAAHWVLTRIFSRLIPLFVLGFVVRMVQTQLLDRVLAQYGLLLIWLVGCLCAYLVFLFILSSDFSLKGIIRNIKNLIPAGAIAFTSGCSLSTMPWTMSGAAKNMKHPELAKAIIPATTNIQQIGDCIANTFLCFLLYTHAYGHAPDAATWGLFSLVFVLARFATAAVIGGAIFIMLPVYETYLHFNAEMIAIILAFNVILDPLITSANVMANGALCRLFEKFWIRFLGKTKQPVK